jgi:hypothetical protein
VPSVKTLRNWEIDLAGGCLAQVIEQIRKDATRMRKWGVKLEITLVTDHGNQESVDHFVKMICWSSVDKHGNHVLRHFTLNIDKGGHTTEENKVFANAKDLKYLKPLSDKLRQWMLKQWLI